MSSILGAFARRSGFSGVSALVVAVGAMGLLGCASSSGPGTRFATPGPGEPRATLRFSKDISGKGPGAGSDETIHMGPVEVTSSEYAVVPGPGRVEYAGARYHFEEHWATESYSVTDSCWSHDSKGNCESRTRYETRNVLVRTKVEDGRCNLSASYAFVAGATYDVHLTQAELTTCSITCEQVGGGACETLSPDVPVPAPVTERYQPSIAHYAGYPITAAGITGVVAGLGWIFANTADSSITNAHCQNNRCDAVGDAEIARSQKAQLPGTIALLGGLGVTAGGLLLINVSGHWVKNPVTVGAAGDRVVVGGTF